MEQIHAFEVIWSTLKFLTYYAKIGIFQHLVEGRNVIKKSWGKIPILDLLYNIGIYIYII